MATTWISMINLILRDSGVLGVGQTAQAQDITDQKSRLNMMLDEWKRNRWLVYCLLDLSVECDGSLYYEIGDGATIDYPRPDEIDAAFARQITAAQPNQPDFPLRIIKSYEEYSQIALKQLSAGPSWALFYESDYPTGKLYPYPLMSDQYERHPAHSIRLRIATKAIYRQAGSHVPANPARGQFPSRYAQHAGGYPGRGRV
jgi:hypothetical protein